MAEVTVIIPAYNEGDVVYDTVKAINQAFIGSGHTFEIIVVDDGSNDDTAQKASLAGAKVIRHPCNLGYGNAILTAVQKARYPLIALADADGTYPVAELPPMVTETDERGLDMLVGARSGEHYYGNWVKRIGRVVLKMLSEFTVGRKIPDINSGMRVIQREMVSKFAPALCGGFSFTTNITMIAFLTNRFVGYRQIDYYGRTGASKVSYLRDTLRTAQVLIAVILMFNPMKLYIPLTIAVLTSGVIALLICVLFPLGRIWVAFISAYLLTAFIIIGLAFLAEQRRVSFMILSEFNAKE